MKNGKSLRPFLALGSSRHLKCPECLEVMDPFRCDNVVVDKCPSCQGIWFDRGKLGIFKRNLDRIDLTKVQEILWPHQDYRLKLCICPRCREAMGTVDFSYDMDVSVERCSRCQGHWLPAEQMLNLIEVSKMSQLIAPDVKGLAAEFLRLRKNLKRWSQIDKIGNGLNQSLQNFLRLVKR